MRLLFGGIAVALVSACFSVQSRPASAQSFDDRWSIIPKAHAEPAPEENNQKQAPPQQAPAAPQTQIGAERRSVKIGNSSLQEPDASC